MDYLRTRDDVDPARAGLVGWSLGGYYAPRAAAFEKRLALVVAWGATEHIGLDHLPHVGTFIADWVADTFAGLDRTAGRPPAHRR